MKETVEVNSYWALESDVSRGFNILKAKLYNLIEATVIDLNQQNAMKGLIKDFANDAYRIALADMRYDAKNAGLIKEEDVDFPMVAHPLERSFGEITGNTTLTA